MDIESIEQLVDIIKNSKISELTVATDGTKVRLTKQLDAAPAAPTLAARKESPKPASLPEPVEVLDTHSTYITAPMVGMYHKSGSDLLGAKIRTGQTVGAIESMKLMNDILSDIEGTITEVLVEDGHAVEYGQNLFKVETA